jgi:hypothetical protein
MEYVAGPSLANVLARHPQGLPAAEARAWLKGLVEGVAYLHDHGIVHRDLKPANIFLEEGTVKIGDYGLAKLITASQGGEHSESIGTCHYMAPEIASGKYNKPIDVYAIGVILYEMLTGRVPFDGESVGEVLMKHLTSRPDVSMLPEPYRAIVARALEKDPARRPERVVDLLPPDDARKPPEVRIIGEGKKGPAPADEPKRAEEEVLRIGAEEPVFYIGPDTTPPRPPMNRRLAEWAARRRWRDRVRRNAAAASMALAARRMAARRGNVTPVRVAAVAPPVSPPSPPPLPGARVRVAELASSMLWAAPAAALLAVPAAIVLGADLGAQPERVAFLFGTTLLGTWGALVPQKLFEGRSIEPRTRRALTFGVGALVGLAGVALASWVELGSLPHSDRPWGVEIDQGRVIRVLSSAVRPSPLVFAAFFGLLFLLASLPWLAARDRPARFRVWPTAKAGAIAALVGGALPFSPPWGAGIAVLTAVVTQLVSPWSAPAAAYSRYAARVSKTGRRVA